jgi:hypothetical protein
MLRDLRTGSTTPLCRFHVITGPRCFLLVSGCYRAVMFAGA